MHLDSIVNYDFEYFEDKVMTYEKYLCRLEFGSIFIGFRGITKQFIMVFAKMYTVAKTTSTRDMADDTRLL